MKGIFHGASQSNGFQSSISTSLCNKTHAQECHHIRAFDMYSCCFWQLSWQCVSAVYVKFQLTRITTHVKQTCLCFIMVLVSFQAARKVKTDLKNQFHMLLPLCWVKKTPFQESLSIVKLQRFLLISLGQNHPAGREVSNNNYYYSGKYHAKIIGKYASEHGRKKTIDHFSSEYQGLKESSVHTFKKANQQQLDRQRRQGCVQPVSSLEAWTTTFTPWTWYQIGVIWRTSEQ